MAKQIIYTAGYGNRTPEQFRKLLFDAHINSVFDVRRQDTGARIASYKPQNMGKTLDVRYYHWYQFGNNGDVDQYEVPKNEIDFLANYIRLYPKHLHCLICSECDAYKNDEVNCHRVFIAEAVSARLEQITGEDWAVVHLPMDIEVIKQPETPELRPCEPTGYTQRGGG